MMRKIISIAILISISIYLFACSTDDTFIMSFETFTDEVIESQTFKETMILPIPEREGYTFDGWYLNDTYEYKFRIIDYTDYESTIPITVYAKWEINEYAILFDSQGGMEIPSINIEYDDSIPQLMESEKSGYVFDGWYLDQGNNQAFNLNKMPAEDITLYAKWNEIEYTINFNSDGGSNIDVIEGVFGIQISEPSPPNKVGYIFDGWYTDYFYNNEFVFDTMPAENVELRAKWIPITFDVSFITNGGTSLEPLSVFWGATLPPVEEPTKPGFSFEDWYIDEGLTTLYENEQITSDLDLYAKWEYTKYPISYYTVTTTMNNGTLDPGEFVVEQDIGGFHSIILTNTGRVFTVGENEQNQLGDGTYSGKTTPVDITSNFGLQTGEQIIDVAAGYVHSVALTSDGRVFTWGYNLNGELGDGNFSNRLYPTDITSNFALSQGEKIIQMNTKYFHSYALTDKNQLFLWGRNDDGQIGNGTISDAITPSNITNKFDLDENETIDTIELGVYNSYVLTSDKRLFAWGTNDFGQLARAVGLDSWEPVQINDSFNLNETESISSMTAGLIHCGIITSSNRVFMWGRNADAQVGNGTQSDVITPSNITYRFGLGTGEVIEKLILGGFHSMALSSSGRIFGWGSNYNSLLIDDTLTLSKGPILLESSLFTNTDLYSISAGYDTTTIITNDMSVISWGDNVNNKINNSNSSISNVDLPSFISERNFTLINSSEISYLDEITLYYPNTTATFNGWYTSPNLMTVFAETIMPPYEIKLYGYYE